MHIFDASISIICIILLLFFTYLFSYLYFDGMHNTNKWNSRKNNKGILFLAIYETILVLCFNFMNGDNYNGILIFIYLVGSCVSFYYLHINCPFNEFVMTKVWSFFSSANIWTGLMVSVAILTENKIFHGIIYAWIIGFPMIFLIILITPSDRK